MQSNARRWLRASAAAACSILLSVGLLTLAAGGKEGSHPYEAFEPNATCEACHGRIVRQHEQSMMSQCYTHEWDEIEYFKLALPHAEKVEKVAEVKAGCNGCHAPLAFLAGDIPPEPPSENSRANESISCDLCHTITGFEGDIPYNFNWIVSPGEIKYAQRGGLESSYHQSKELAFFRTAEFCGTCHNEKDPFGQWVKATHLEWKESPYAKAGIVCQDCHMPPAPGQSSPLGEEHPDIRQHLFNGAHDPAKLAGAVDVRIYPNKKKIKPGKKIELDAVLLNNKAGHKVPTGSVEERVLWLHVEARDSAGNIYHLPVDAKGFDGEHYTIASGSALAYQDIGDIQGIENFPGLKRDGLVPDGDRIFRMPYLDPAGRMTVAQWNTAGFGPDYRLAPFEAVSETFTWTLPEHAPEGRVEVTARVYYSRLVSSVGEFLGVPEDEWKPVLINEHSTTFEVQKAR